MKNAGSNTGVWVEKDPIHGFISEHIYDIDADGYELNSEGQWVFNIDIIPQEKYPELRN